MPAAAALLVCLAACTAERAQPSDVYGVLPLTSMVTEGAELRALLSAAEDEHISVCMARQGFEFVPVRAESRLAAGMVVEPTLTVEQASEVGYRQAEHQLDDPVGEYLQGLSQAAREEFAQALHGTGSNTVEIDAGFGRLSVSTDGCLAEAREATAGSVTQSAQWVVALNHVELLLHDAQARRDADSEVSDAYARWSDCMGRAGFDVDSFDEAIQLAWSTDYSPSDPASDWELTVATADAECRQSDGLDELRRERQSHYENTVLADNEEIILTWQEVSASMRALLMPGGHHDEGTP